ncbi:hypothetical protein [Paracraurococcus lichenis]|uniref:JmjC domain-containing protein n=1 Tax=Paracraurococcus lichenis TaxID=3064888 RepID=A0ABT9E8P7_9PROT|nr:hypothetical protein [Paracraurococcus sp. LOR1-02]MDO9712577.1 hypothetical protein [Paracraurococcus sp. LOR1-02]
MSRLTLPNPAKVAATPRPVLVDPDARFAQHHNASSFLFTHGLTGNPLFALPSLLALAERTPDHRDTYWSNGKVEVTDRWERSSDGRLSLQETIEGIRDNNSLVILKHAEQDREIAPLLQGVLASIVEYCGDTMRRDIIVGEVLILISSPNRLTPYHVDAESNFLLQVTGDKTICLFNQDDPGIITHKERESYFLGNYNSAIYTEEKQAKAAAYDLRAGNGVHIPVFAPHWVRNHDNVSVALSVNYELRSIARMARVYQANHHLRKLGLAPRPPGASRLRDGMKSGLVRGLDVAKRLFRQEGLPCSAGWTPGQMA